MKIRMEEAQQEDLESIQRITLKELRKKKGLTQKEVATLLNIPLKSYQIYEKDISRIEMACFFQICDKLDYPIEQIQV